MRKRAHTLNKKKKRAQKSGFLLFFTVSRLFFGDRVKAALRKTDCTSKSATKRAKALSPLQSVRWPLPHSTSKSGNTCTSCASQGHAVVGADTCQKQRLDRPLHLSTPAFLSCFSIARATAVLLTNGVFVRATKIKSWPPCTRGSKENKSRADHAARTAALDRVTDALARRDAGAHGPQAVFRHIADDDRADKTLPARVNAPEVPVFMDGNILQIASAPLHTKKGHAEVALCGCRETCNQ